MPTLNSAIRGQWVQFNIVVGRIMLQNSPVGPIDTGPNTASRKDHLSIQAENGETALVYEGANNKEQFNIDACGNSRLTLRRVPKNDPQAIAVEFRQEPRGKSVLLLGPEGKQQILVADSLWHLFLLYPEQSRKHLAPLLQTLQPNWRLAETADAIERALGHNGDVAVSYDRANWGRWVAQLGDENFARREAADRELRRRTRHSWFFCSNSISIGWTPSSSSACAKSSTRFRRGSATTRPSRSLPGSPATPRFGWRC